MKEVIDSFGEEWTLFDQEIYLPKSERKNQFLRYFNTDHFQELKKIKNLRVIDIGAGSGRWSREIFNHLDIGEITLIEPSKAFKSLVKIFKQQKNVELINKPIENLTNNFPELKSNFDLAYCFGVLHHTNSIQNNFNQLCNLVRPGGYIFCYLYYDFENRSKFYKFFYFLTILPRFIISRLPSKLKNFFSDLIAVFVYLPLVQIAKKFPNNSNMLLHGYIDRSFFSIRTDSRDRFGTKVEKRISKKEIRRICKKNGLKDIKFSDTYPYWVFSAIKNKF